MKILVLFLATSVAFGQKQSPKIRRVDWVLLAADTAARGLDVYSTHRMLTGANREDMLPAWVAHHNTTMIVYSGAVVAGEYYLTRKLVRHHKWARVVLSVDAVATASFAIHNLYLPVPAPLVPCPVAPIAIPD